MSQKHVTARVPAELYAAIEEVRETEHVDRSTAIKRLLQRGIDEWRLEVAVEGYREGRLSMGAAAERAELSLWRFIDVLEEREVPVKYTEEDLAADIAAVRGE